MIKNSIFSTFLMLSILIILAGILFIIFIQFDRGYVSFNNGANYQQEQKNLINHIYKTQVQPTNNAVENPLVMKLNKATVVIQPQSETASLSVVEPQAPAAKTEIVEIQPAKVPAEKITIATYKTQPENIIPAQPSTPQISRNIMPQKEDDDYYAQLLRNNPWSPYYRAGQ
jgi:hypothetical protein